MVKEELDFEVDFDEFDSMEEGIEEETEIVEETEGYIEEEMEMMEEAEDYIEETEEQTEEEEEAAESATEEAMQVDEEKNKKSGGIFSKKLPDLILYIITDKPVYGLLSYFRGYGVQVSQVFGNLSDARDVLLMQVEPCRIVIMETGTGRFTNIAARRALTDLLGISDEDNKISVFYTDSIVREQVEYSEEADKKEIEWCKFKSTADVLANILRKKKKENYIYDTEDSEEEVPEDILKCKGLTVGVVNEMDLGMPTVTLRDIRNSLDNDTDGIIDGYRVKY